MTQTHPLLELRDATVVRDGKPILHVDRLVFSEGEHIVILGPNGSGKSTLIGLLTRDIRPLYREDPPPVRFLGKERWHLFDARKLFGVVSADWQRLHQVPLTVRQTVISGFFGSVGVHPSREPSAEQRAVAEQRMTDLGIEHLADRTMDTLSTGEARRALIARALVHDPPVLVLDEPCAGLDPPSARDVRNAYEGLAEKGRSLVLVTHHLEDIVPAVSRAIMLRQGRVFADGPVEEILTSSRVGELFGFDATVESRNGRYLLW